MPWTPPAAGVKRTPANFEGPLKTFVDNLETTANTALSTAQAAQTAAGLKYQASSADIARWAAAVCVSTTNARVPGSALTLFTGADPGTGATAGVDLWIGDLA